MYRTNQHMMKNNFKLDASEHLLEALAADLSAKRETPYDPEMIYVECRKCGKPVMWEKGRSTYLVKQSQVNPMLLDEYCLITTDGCIACSPESDGFSLSMVRLTNLSQQDLIFLTEIGGNS